MFQPARPTFVQNTASHASEDGRKVGGDQDVERTNDVWTWTLLVCGDESHTGYCTPKFICE